MLAIMDIRELRTLALAAETGSLQTTAQRAGLTPGAVHHHLKMLEAEFGAPVYEAGRAGLELTALGKLLLPFAQRILAQHEAASAAVRDWREGGRGMVRVGAGPSFASHLLPALIKRYRRKHRGVEVFAETGSSDLVDRLRAGSLDLIFHMPAELLESPDLELAARWRAPARFIANRRTGPARCRVDQLRRLPFILYEQGRGAEPLIGSYLARLGIEPKVVMRSDSAETIKSAIRAGMGISVLFLWNVTADPRQRSYVAIRTGAPSLEAHMGLFRMRDAYASRPVLDFIAMARRMSWRNLELAGEASGRNSQNHLALQKQHH